MFDLLTVNSIALLARMAVTKISVSLEEETLAATRLAAEEAGLSLSAWLSQAA
ncbi:MAG: hypothetical protein ACRDSR_01485 [Pseudonocardiaceae bacterium]